MTFQAAIIKEQGVIFTVVVVKSHVIAPGSARNNMVAAMSNYFRTSVVLMAQDHRGRASFWGRPDLVRFLARVPVGALPWRKISTAA